MPFKLITIAAAIIFKTECAFSGCWYIWLYVFLNLLCLLVSPSFTRRENVPYINYSLSSLRCIFIRIFLYFWALEINVLGMLMERVSSAVLSELSNQWACSIILKYFECFEPLLVASMLICALYWDQENVLNWSWIFYWNLSKKKKAG